MIYNIDLRCSCENSLSATASTTYEQKEIIERWNLIHDLHVAEGTTVLEAPDTTEE